VNTGDVLAVTRALQYGYRVRANPPGRFGDGEHG